MGTELALLCGLLLGATWIILTGPQQPPIIVQSPQQQLSPTMNHFVAVPAIPVPVPPSLDRPERDASVILSTPSPTRFEKQIVTMAKEIQVRTLSHVQWLLSGPHDVHFCLY